MTDQSKGNPKKPNTGNGSSSRADQPTPVSGSAQSQGTQSTTGNMANQGSQTGQGGQAAQAVQAATTELKQTGNQLANEAKNAVGEVANDLKGQAVNVANEAQEQATHFLDEQKGMAAERIGGVAQALRQAGEEFEGRDERMLAQYTNSFASQLEGFSNSLRDREVGAIMNDARQLAYRQPEMFVVGALAAGFLLGRFLKSSSRQAMRGYGENYGSQNYGGQNYGQNYGREYGQTYGPDYSTRETGQFGSGQNFGQNYGQSYTESSGQEYGRRYEQNYEREDDRNQYFGQGTGSSSNQSNQSTQNRGQGMDQRTSQSTGQSLNQSGSGTQATSAGQPTPLGDAAQVSPGQVELQQGKQGQEFGQGETQVTNPSKTLPPSESDRQTGTKSPNQRNEEGKG